MKPLYIALLSATTALLVACGGDDTKSDVATPTAQNEAPAPNYDEPPLNNENPFSNENLTADSAIDYDGSPTTDGSRSIIDKEKGMAAVEAGRRAVEAGIGAINRDEVSAIANELAVKAGKMAATYGAKGDLSGAEVNTNPNTAVDYQSFGPQWKKIDVKSTRVIDGDTVEVLLANQPSQRIRLLGIDAPESSQTYGDISTKVLEHCIAGKPVSIVYENEDRYGRLLGIVMAANTDCNYEQVKQGAAWHYKQYQKGQPSNHAKTYAQAEKAAKDNRIGLWADNAAQEPWLYRKANK